MNDQDQYIETIKRAALSMGKRLVLDFIVSKIPFFGLSVINPIIGWVVGKILEIAITKTEMGIFFIYVDLRTSAQGRAFEAAALKNQNATTGKEKIDAEKNLIDSFRAFVKFTN